MFRVLFALVIALACSSVSWAQTTRNHPAAVRIPAASAEQILLPTASEAGPDMEQWNQVLGQVWVRNVSRPSLYRFAPMNGRDNRRAVIVVPGGGNSFVSIESEGFWVAQRLAAQGYTAFVLKYRPRPTPEAPAEFMRQISAEWAELNNDEIDVDSIRYTPAVDDLAAALSFVHTQSSEWGLDPSKVGVIGFSAGALSTIDMLEKRKEASFIDNVALIYPPMLERIEAATHPDLFMAIAVNDPLFRKHRLAMVDSWLSTSPRVEFHLYSGGAHGFGMRPQGTTSDLWIDQYLAWLAVH